MQASEGVQDEDTGEDQAYKEGQYRGTALGLVMYIELFV